MENREVFASSNANWWEGGQKVKAGETFQPRKLNTPLDKLTRKKAGRRSLTKTERKHGRYIKSRPAGDNLTDIAFDATIRAAAPFQTQRTEERKKLAFSIKKSDLQRKVRAVIDLLAEAFGSAPPWEQGLVAAPHVRGDRTRRSTRRG